jgi:hypothetical protein
LVVAAACLLVGMLAASRASIIPLLIRTYGLVTGLGVSIAFVVGYATPPQWFHRRRGLATSLASACLVGTAASLRSNLALPWRP